MNILLGVLVFVDVVFLLVLIYHQTMFSFFMDESNKVVVHTKCEKCGLLGHKEDMVNSYYLGNSSTFSSAGYYYHENCYVRVFNKKKCTCGKSWVDKGAK